MRRHLQFIVRIFIVVTITFTLARGLLFLSNKEYFAELSLPQILLAFAHGIRFDLSIMAALLLIPLLLTFVPGKLFRSRHWYSIIGWFVFLMLALAILALGMDLMFFQHVKRHVGTELIQMKDDMGYLFTMLKSYWYIAGIYLVAMAVFAKFWASWVIPTEDIPATKFWQTLIALPVTLFCLVLIARGGLVTGKPISIIDAFITDSTELANLSLNGVFTGLKITLKSMEKGTFNHRHHSDEHIQKTLGIPNSYPFEQRYSAKENKPNIFLLQIESLNFSFIDALKPADSTEQKYGVTPYLDSLVTQSRVYDRFYAAGQRSIVGLQATWSGIPSLLGLPTVHSGLTTSKITQVAKIAKQRGYSTYFAQTSERSSYRVDALMKNLGFEHYWGKEDIQTLLLDYPADIEPHFGYDYETLMLLQKNIKQQADRQQNEQKNNHPILMGFFSGTTHSPYIRLPKQFEKYPHHRDKIGGMLNSLAYTDWSIQQFIEGLKNEPWFNNSIFIITADHTAAHLLPKQASYDEIFHIPLIIYSPNPTLIKPERIQEVRSQLDIMPTLVDLMGADTPIAAMGNSLFQPPKYPLINNMGYLVGAITEQGYLQTDLTKIVDSNLPTKEADSLFQTLLMQDQRVAESLMANQWAH